jgi:hypothetical protein
VSNFIYPRARARLKAFLHKRQGGLCCYCDKPTLLHPDPWPLGTATPDNFATLEHLRRKADGGTNHPDNLAIACFECNAGRGELSWVEWKTLMSRKAA